MKQLRLLLIFIILGLRINAQNKLSFSFDVSPTLSYRNYKLIDYSQGNSIFPSGKFYYNKFRNLYDSIESPKYGFQISLNLSYNISNKFSILAGIQYKNIGTRYDITPLLAVFHYNETANYIFGEKPVIVYSKFHYIGIPVSLQYKVCSFNKLNILINAGSTIDFLISHEEGSELKTNPYTSQIANASDYSKVAININGGIKFSYPMNNHWDIDIMPLYTQYVTPNVKINLYTSDDLFLKFNQFNYHWTLKFEIKYRI